MQHPVKRRDCGKWKGQRSGFKVLLGCRIPRASFVPELSGTPFRILFSGRNVVLVTLCVLKAELHSGSVPPTPGQTPERGGSSIIVTTKKKKFRLRRAFITPVLQFRSRFH